VLNTACRRSILAASLILLVVGCASSFHAERIGQPDFFLIGYWARETAGASMLLSMPIGGPYPIRFSYSGCVANEVVHLTAKFENGFLLLSQPVTGYEGETYRKLALFQLDDKEVLVDESNMADFTLLVETGRDSKGQTWHKPADFGFTRLSVIP